MIDNFSLIEHCLLFDSDDDFYSVELLKRKKENPGAVSDIVLKDWIIHSTEHFNLLKSDMIALANYFNARVVIRLNKRSFKKCAYKTMNLINDCFMKDEIPHTGKLLAKAIGLTHNESKTKWILDVDDHLIDSDYVNELCSFINDSINPIGNKIVELIPSKSGCHIITYGFNPNELKKKYPEIVINKDGPTNVYIP